MGTLHWRRMMFFTYVFISISLILGLFLGLARPAHSDWVQDDGYVNQFSADALGPRIACLATTPYVTWYESSGFTQILVKHFNGVGWEQDGVSLNVNVASNASMPQLAFCNSTPYVVWEEYFVLTTQIYAKYFTGGTWTQIGGSLNVNFTGIAHNPTLAFAGTTPFAAWQEGMFSNIYVKYYNGSDWELIGGSLNVNSGNSASHPSLAITATTPYVAWSEGASISQIYVKCYNGSNWEPIGGSLNVDSNQGALYPRLAFTATTPYVVWEEPAGVSFHIYVKHFSSGAWTQDGGSLNVNDNRDAVLPDLAMTGATPYVAWEEANGTADQVYVKNYNGSNWELVGGSLNLNSNLYALSPSLAFSGSTPYVVWEEMPGFKFAYVKHYVPDTPTQTPTRVASPTATESLTPTQTPTRMVSPTAMMSPTLGATLTATPGLSPPLDFFRLEHALARPGRGESVRVAFTLPYATHVQLTLYDLLGRIAAIPLNDMRSAGHYQFTWSGAGVSAGMYFVSFEAAGKRARAKVVVVR